MVQYHMQCICQAHKEKNECYHIKGKEYEKPQERKMDMQYVGRTLVMTKNEHKVVTFTKTQGQED